MFKLLIHCHWCFNFE